MPSGEWICPLRISAATIGKINSKHGITEQEIRDAIECREGLDAVWEDHPDRGRRLIVRFRWRQIHWLAVCYRDETDAFRSTFNLGSVYADG